MVRFRAPSADQRARASRLVAAIIALLDRRAGHRSIRTIDTAIAWLRFKNRTTSLAVIEPLTGIGRYGLSLDMAASRTADYRYQNGRV